MFALSNADVHVWLTQPDTVPAHDLSHYVTLLSDDERDRHRRFHFDRDRQLFLVAHAQLRLILSRYADVRPEEWRFRSSDRGRPFIDSNGAETPLHFSLSHTHGLIAVAVSRAADVGIDVEAIARQLDWTLLGARVCSADELATLGSLPHSEASRHFLQLWTLKEAYSKARGLGLAIDFTHVAFDLVRHDISVRFGPSVTDDAASWSFESREAIPGFQMSLAARLPDALPLRTQIRVGPHHRARTPGSNTSL